jgi:hypothetical protein
MEQNLREVVLELACRKSVMAYVEFLEALLFDWDGIVGAIKNVAIAEFMSFYSSTIDILGDRPDLQRACTLPASRNFGMSRGEGANAFDVTNSTMKSSLAF